MTTRFPLTFSCTKVLSEENCSRIRWKRGRPSRVWLSVTISEKGSTAHMQSASFQLTVKIMISAKKNRKTFSYT